MRSALASPRHAQASTVAAAASKPVVRGARAALPWLGAVLFAFLLFRLLFGHLYLMRGVCECGQTEQWFEFNDRPYAIGVRLSAKAIAPGNAQHDHRYREPVRARRY